MDRLSGIVVIALAAAGCGADVACPECPCAECGRDCGGPTPVPSSGVARLLARTATDDYEAATMSFEHATVLEDGEVRNDWDLLFGNDRDPDCDEFRVNTVTDDRSFIVDKGNVAFADLPQVLDPPARGDGPCDGADCIPAVQGHLYVVRTLDRDTRQYAAFRVLAHERNRSVDLYWYRSPLPDWFVWAPAEQ